MSPVSVTPLPGTDHSIEVRLGNVPGHTMVAIEGHDEDLTTTRTTVHPSGSTANIDQSGIDGTPATIDVASTDVDDTSAGAGVRTLTLIGLDSSGDAQSETITMDGQTEVTSSSTYSAIIGLRCLTWGASTNNEGTIWAGNGVFTAGVPATKYFSMNPQFNKALTAYYVVPAGKTLYLREFTMTVATTNKDVDFYVEQSSNGINWFTELVFGMEPGEFQDDIIAIDGIAAGQHVRVEAKSSAASTDVSTVLSCELVDS